MIDLLSFFNGEIRVKQNISARDLTTFGVGGNVSWLVEPCTMGVLPELIKFLGERKVPWKILGGASNLLFPDDKFDEVVIRLGREFAKYVILDPQQAEDLKCHMSVLADLFRSSNTTNQPKTFLIGSEVSVLAFAGTPLMQLSRELCQLGYSGLEFAAGIPASIGGAVKMNAGAHGFAMASVVDQVFVVDGKGKIKSFSNPVLNFSYRHSNIDHQAIVFAVLLKLTAKDPQEVTNFRRRCLDYRKQTQPLHLPSAGSVFRNPEETSAAKLLEEAGMKGQKKGGVCYSPMHSNWLVRVEERALVAEVKELINLGKERVEGQFGVKLVPEIVIW